MNNNPRKTIIATLLITISILTAYIVNAQITSTAIIQSTGQISIAEIWAKSGSPKDIQTAVDIIAAAGGGIVYVPEGNFTFNIDGSKRDPILNRPVGVLIPGGVSVIGAGIDKTILTQTQLANGTPASMFFVDGSNGMSSRISGITFHGYVVDETNNIAGVTMYNCKKYRVDHCKFIDFNSYAITTWCHSSKVKYENGRYTYHWNWGLIDHCEIDNPYKDTIGGAWAYGIGVFGPGRPDAWLYNLSDILGKWDIETNPIRCALYQWNESTSSYDLIDQYGGENFRWLVYIEDCNFSRCRHCTASNAGAFYVVRNSVFQRPRSLPMVDIHGAMSAQGWGGRGAEVYNNTFYGEKDTHGAGNAISYRGGGGGVVFNNTIINCTAGIQLTYEGEDTNQICWCKDIWIWNNTFQNVNYEVQDPFNLYEEGVDYFLQQKPNYTPYPYPHPLSK